MGGDQARREERYERPLPRQSSRGTSRLDEGAESAKEISYVIAKVDEELAEAKGAIASRDPSAIADEIGDLLFAVVNLARKSKLDAETALQTATDKFVSRFNKVEAELRGRGKELGEVGLEELDQMWNAVKLKALGGSE